MIVATTYGPTGDVIGHTEADLDAGALSFYEHGALTSTRPMTDAERASIVPAPQPTPLTLPALLVVKGVLDLADAANAACVAPEAIVAEAQAWAVAGSL